MFGKPRPPMRLLPLLAGLVLSGCSLFGLDGGTGERTQMRRLEARIDALIGVPYASDLSQCRVLPVGSKPCGGPWRYKVYSASQTDTTQLYRLAEEYAALERRLNAREGRISTCDVTMAPTLALEDGVCVAVR